MLHKSSAWPLALLYAALIVLPACTRLPAGAIKSWCGGPCSPSRCRPSIGRGLTWAATSPVTCPWAFCWAWAWCAQAGRAGRCCWRWGWAVPCRWAWRCCSCPAPARALESGLAAQQRRCCAGRGAGLAAALGRGGAALGGFSPALAGAGRCGGDCLAAVVALGAAVSRRPLALGLGQVLPHLEAGLAQVAARLGIQCVAAVALCTGAGFNPLGYLFCVAVGALIPCLLMNLLVKSSVKRAVAAALFL